MNSLAIVLFSALFLGAGYIFYGRALERFFGIDPENITPAHKNFDGVDYVPASNWLILFSHHFASIAGAGPIVGPIIAAAIWGWAPALVWIIVGTIFLGGVHDFASIVISVRHGARSIADVTEEVISKKSKLIFLGFVWLALILVIAVFTSICARTLTASPVTVIPCFGLIGAAVIVGLLLHRLNVNIFLATLAGLLLLVGFIAAGSVMPVELGANSFKIWSVALLVYAFIASVTPVNVLLQPRDYLSSFLLYFGIIGGFIGIIVTHPALNIAAFKGVSPEMKEWLWPMLFVTIACGANSGFHAFVSSGTTSKQMPNERYIKRIGYGAMVLEAFLAVLAVMAVSAGLTSGRLGAILSKGGPGPIGAFGEGYKALTGGMFFGKGDVIAILILNAFILTTLDTATRICRYLSEELFKIKNRFFATFVVVFTGGILALSGKWSVIWPMFGASNQLVAALTFVAISAWLLSKGKSLKFTFFPAVFMLFTSLGALVYQLIGFIKQGNVILSCVSVALVSLACMMVVDALRSVKFKAQN